MFQFIQSASNETEKGAFQEGAQLEAARPYTKVIVEEIGTNFLVCC